jgi:hypothetical protein
MIRWPPTTSPGYGGSWKSNISGTDPSDGHFAHLRGHWAYHAVREATEEQVGLSAKALQPMLDETAMRIHLQRVVGAFVGSAHGAATFYGTKVTLARDLTSKLANDDRDEDRDGVYGSDSKAARAREFAAKAGLKAFALLAAAEGAVNAYAEVTGEDWKPYEGSSTAQMVGRRSANAEMEALG